MNITTEETPEYVTVNGVKFYPEKSVEKEGLFCPSDVSWWVKQDGDGDCFIESPCFTKDSYYADDMARALQVIWELKMCEGVVEPDDDVMQYCVDSEIDTNRWMSFHCKNIFISPIFDTEENCQAAIDKVGRERIKKAMETWHRVA